MESQLFSTDFLDVHDPKFIHWPIFPVSDQIATSDEHSNWSPDLVVMHAIRRLMKSLPHLIHRRDDVTAFIDSCGEQRLKCRLVDDYRRLLRHHMPSLARVSCMCSTLSHEIFFPASIASMRSFNVPR